MKTKYQWIKTPVLERFNLHDQVIHKINFFEENLSNDTPIILLGHSIGAYIALKIFHQLQDSGFNIIKVLGLFPTIEQMALSPNGVKMGGVLEVNSYNPLFINIPSFSFLIIMISWLELYCLGYGCYPALSNTL